MTTLQITDEGLKEIVDGIEIPCAACGAPAKKVIRCKRFRSAHALRCLACFDELVRAVAQVEHIHCGLVLCPDVGTELLDVVDVLDL